MKNLILILFIMLGAGYTFAQQGITVCHTPPTESFAVFASNKSFNSDHSEPIAYEHKSDIGKMIEIPTADGKTANAYVLESQVDTDDYVFVIHEWWGLNGHIKKMAEKIYTDVGVNVIAIDLYDGKVADTREKASEYMQGVDDQRARTIIQGAIDYIGNSAEIVTIGWCFGGGWSLQSAMMMGDQARGAVIYYGMPENDVEKIKEKVSFPVLGIFAKKDDWVTPEIVNKFEDNMNKAQKKLYVHFYDAPHAFANPSNPDYDEESAKDAYKKAVGFVKRELN